MELKEIVKDFIEEMVKRNMSLFHKSSEDIRKIYPHLNNEQISRKLIFKANLSTAAVGVGTTVLSQLPMLAGPTGIVASLGANAATAYYDFQKCTNIQSALVVKIAALYGYQLDEKNELHRCIVLESIFGQELELAAQLAGKFIEKGAKILLKKYFTESIVKQLYRDILEKIGVNVASRVTSRQIAKFIPLIGPLTVGAINWWAAGSVGETAIKIFSAARNKNVEL
ncbi:MAG: hypothetical protein QMC67_10295 [Candidatus Wallbacteria bacterium]